MNSTAKALAFLILAFVAANLIKNIFHIALTQKSARRIFDNLIQKFAQAQLIFFLKE
jgi:hypothetical protein